MIKMRDRRLTIAVVIIVLLALALVYLLFISPGINGYIVKKQIDAQQIAVDAIVQIVDQQGYVALTDSNNNSVVLIKYEQPEQAS